MLTSSVVEHPPRKQNRPRGALVPAPFVFARLLHTGTTVGSVDWENHGDRLCAAHCVLRLISALCPPVESMLENLQSL